MVKTLHGVLVASMAAALCAVPIGFAARSPTLDERAAIVRALPTLVRNTPVECVWLKIRVSRNPRYALADLVYVNTNLMRCARFTADGFFVLKKSRVWRVVYVGSDFPRCSMKIPRDLVGCRP